MKQRIIVILAAIAMIIGMVFAAGTANAGTRVGGKATVGVISVDPNGTRVGAVNPDGTRVGANTNGTRVGSQTDGTRVGLRANVNAVAAAAGPPCAIHLTCGTIKYLSGPTFVFITISNSWSTSCNCMAGNKMTLVPGNLSSNYALFKDTDGFRIPAGYQGCNYYVGTGGQRVCGAHYVGGRDYKITDNVWLDLKVYK